ncbi:tail fiber assembly protein [Escherichia coli]|uniref:tail fiber assembly protein n=1 Tax=Escherichia coli TaxID=562 RepID=UPI001F152CC0
MSMTFAVIENNIVVNIIVWDGISAYEVGGDQTLIPLPTSGGGPAPGIGWSYINGKFIAPPRPQKSQAELIQAAEIERQRLLKYANDVMFDWRTELMLGEISDANREKLSTWQAYKNEVKAVDVTTAPENVNWPVPPEV